MLNDYHPMITLTVSRPANRIFSASSLMMSKSVYPLSTIPDSGIYFLRTFRLCYEVVEKGPIILIHPVPFFCTPLLLHRRTDERVDELIRYFPLSCDLILPELE